VIENVSIPPGVNSGTNLRMAGKGHMATGGGQPGDLLVKITVK